MTVSLVLIIFAAFLVSWIIGANSVSTAFAPVASTDASGVLRGALFAGVFGLIGAVVQGDKVAGTIGSGLLVGKELPIMAGSIILLTAALIVIVGIFSQIPTPVAFTVVSGVLGAGLGLENSWDISQIQIISATWIAIPFISIFLGYVFSRALRFFLSRGSSEGSLNTLVFLVGAFCAYTAGANLVGLAVGPLMNSVSVSLKLLLLAGGITILFGAWMGGPRIVNTVSRGYSEMGARRSICALLTAAVIAQTATILGIPVSFNEAIIASVIGSGLAAGTGRIQLKKIGKTVSSWVGSFFASMGIVWALTAFFVA